MLNKNWYVFLNLGVWNTYRTSLWCVTKIKNQKKKKKKKKGKKKKKKKIKNIKTNQEEEEEKKWGGGGECLKNQQTSKPGQIL